MARLKQTHEAGPQTVPPVRRFQDLIIFGKVYQLCYKFGSYSDAEKLAGCNIFVEWPKCFARAADGNGIVLAAVPSSALLGAVFWASLVGGGLEVSHEEAVELITPATHFDVIIACAKAWYLSSRDPTAPADETVAPGDEGSEKS